MAPATTDRLNEADLDPRGPAGGPDDDPDDFDPAPPAGALPVPPLSLVLRCADAGYFTLGEWPDRGAAVADLEAVARDEAEYLLAARPWDAAGGTVQVRDRLGYVFAAVPVRAA